MKYATFNTDGTLNQRLIKSIHPIPKDAVEVDDVLWQRMIKESDGIWSLDSSGRITKQPLPKVPLTKDGIERLRLAAYAEPVSGSDRYFAEANRMQIMGEPGWEQVRQTAIDRFNEIQAKFPWPEAAAPHP